MDVKTVVNNLAKEHINRTKKTTWFRNLERSNDKCDKEEVVMIINRIMALYQ